MNRSISLRHHAAFATAGGAASFTGWNDQNARSSSVIVRRLDRATFPAPAPAGQGAPIFTHSVSTATCSGDKRSLASGGI